MNASDLLEALLDGEHPHSLCAKGRNGPFHTVGFYADPAELLDAAAEQTRQHRDVWFGVQGLHGPLDKGRGGDADVAEVRAIPADLDWYDPDAHADPALLPETEVRRLVASFEYEPTITVETGHGLQLYWELTGPVDPTRGKALIDRMHLALAGHGLQPEGEDLARVLRVPSTLNYKSDPVEVRVAGTTTAKYGPDWLEKRLPKNSSSSSNGTRTKSKWKTLDETALHPADIKALRLLEQAGGHDAFVGGDDTVCVLRPGKDSGSSATIGFAGPGMVRVFTSAWPPFTKNTTYDLDEIRALLNGHRPAQHDAGRSAPTLTDLGNARRLVEAFGEDLRHVPQLGQWIRWEGTRWEEDVTGQVMRHAKSVAEAIINEAQGADDDRRKAIGKHWLTSQNAARLWAMVDLAATEPGIPVRIEELDSDPWMLNTATGVIDLRTGTCRPARREDLMTKRAGTYDPDAKAPKWRGFLAEIFDGDDELTGLMQRSAGIALTGDVSEQFLWFLHGGGANGKSTYINQQRRTLGDYSIQLDPRLLMASDHQEHPTGLTDLRGVRFAATVEVEQGRRLAEVLVKQLTGGDPIRARRMHKDNFEFLPTHKIWMAANHLPQITGTDHAIWRRILLIPFTQTFTGDRVDRDLPGKLAAETPGVLAWAVEGCLDWQSNGLQIPDRVPAATDAYRANEDHVGRFLLDCFTPDANDFVTAARLRETYEQWCSINGEKPWTAQSLGRELTSRGYDSVKQGGAKRWLGLRSADGLDLSGVA